MRVKSILLTIFFPLAVFVFMLIGVANAEDVSFGISSNFPIIDNEVKNGDVIVTSSGGFLISSKEYDTGITGIVSENPAVSINIADAQGSDPSIKRYPVIASGNALVNVSTINGAIHKGDLITTSNIKGVAMKALKSGYVIGNALEDFDSTNTNEVQLINVSMNIHYFSSRASDVKAKLSDIFKISAIATTEEPIVVFKYIVAALVVMISIIFGFLSFGRIAKSGIEALGRNPLAGRLIQAGIIINTIVTVTIIAAGVLIGLFIIRL